MFRTFSILLLLLLCIASPFPLAASVSEKAISAEEYAVYSALINDRYLRQGDKLIVIMDKTEGNAIGGSEPDRDEIIRRLPSLQPLTVNDYELKNKKPEGVKNLLKLKADYVLLSQTDRFQLFIGQYVEGWVRFTNKYPEASGLVQLSRVGFNNQKNQALVYIDHSCGAKCGAASYALLKEHGGNWKVEGLTEIWGQ